MSIKDKINEIIEQASNTREYYKELFSLAYYLASEIEDLDSIELVEQHVGTEVRWFFRRRKDD